MTQANEWRPDHRVHDTIVVTGASGHVGRGVADRLLSAGQPVRVVARRADKLAALGERGAQVRTGSFQDQAFLTDALRGAKAAFLLTPIDVALPDLNTEQRKNVVSIAAAIREAGISHVVLLSSWGADEGSTESPEIGTLWFEELLGEIAGLNAIYLRSTWFMDNFLWNIGLIKSVGVNGLALEADLAFPMISTRDVAAVAADYLLNPTFEGRSIRYLYGPRDYTMTEVSRILGASIGKPDLKYVRFPAPIMRRGLTTKGGMSPNAADLLIAVNDAINSRRIRPVEPRSTSNTTPTTLEEFARTTFAPEFHAAPQPGVWDRLGGMLLRSYLSATSRRAA